MYIRNVLGVYYATMKRADGGYIGMGRSFAEAIADCLQKAGLLQK